MGRGDDDAVAPAEEDHAAVLRRVHEVFKASVLDLVLAFLYRGAHHTALKRDFELRALLPAKCVNAAELGLPVTHHTVVFTRPLRVWEVMIWLERRYVGLARGAPACGKTAFLKLLAAAYQQFGWEVVQCDFRGVSTEEDFQATFLHQTGMSVSDFKMRSTELIPYATQQCTMEDSKAARTAELLRQLREISPQMAAAASAASPAAAPPAAPADAAGSAATASTQQPLILLLDEVQSLWPAIVSGSGQIPLFFAHLRTLHEKKAHNVRVLAFGTFPDAPGGTNTGFGHDGGEDPGHRLLGLSDLRFTESEMRMYISIRTAAFDTAPLCREARITLWRLSNGHCGIVSAFLQQIEHAFKDKALWRVGAATRTATLMQIQQHMTFPSNQFALSSATRALHPVNKLVDYELKTATYLLHLLKAIKYSASNGHIKPLAPGQPVLFLHDFEDLFRRGFLSPINGDPTVFSFVAPLLRNVLIMRLGRFATSMPSTCQQLVLDTLKAMRGDVLQRIHPNHSETTFSNEFMAALMTRVPADVTIRGEVWTTDRRGRIDYLLEWTHGREKAVWGVELLHHGLDAKSEGTGKTKATSAERKEHIDRFAEGGVYETFQMTDYALLDFRTYGVTTKSSSGTPRTYTVEFDSDQYTSCVVTPNKLSKKYSPQPLAKLQLCTEVPAKCACPRCQPARYAQAADVAPPAPASAPAPAPAPTVGGRKVGFKRKDRVDESGSAAAAADDAGAGEDDDGAALAGSAGAVAVAAPAPAPVASTKSSKKSPVKKAK